MALAFRFDQMIRDGVVKDQAELARLGLVTRARVTQVMALLDLAPDIQAHILGVQFKGIVVSERRLRPIAALACWDAQWRAWAALTSARQ